MSHYWIDIDSLTLNETTKRFTHTRLEIKFSHFVQFRLIIFVRCCLGSLLERWNCLDFFLFIPLRKELTIGECYRFRYPMVVAYKSGCPWNCRRWREGITWCYCQSHGDGCYFKFHNGIYCVLVICRRVVCTFLLTSFYPTIELFAFVEVGFPQQSWSRQSKEKRCLGRLMCLRTGLTILFTIQRGDLPQRW